MRLFRLLSNCVVVAAALALASCSNSNPTKEPVNEGAKMPVKFVNPEGLVSIDVYRQVSIATGSKIVSIAGQVAWDRDGATLGKGDLAAQVEQCYLNIGTALSGVGGSFDDVTKLTIYVVYWTPDKMDDFLEGRSRAIAKLGVEAVPPATLIGVAALDEPDHLVEIEATAVLP